MQVSRSGHMECNTVSRVLSDEILCLYTCVLLIFLDVLFSFFLSLSFYICFLLSFCFVSASVWAQSALRLLVCKTAGLLLVQLTLILYIKPHFEHPGIRVCVSLTSVTLLYRVHQVEERVHITPLRLT